MHKPKVVAVVGPTASGKTDLAITLAKQFNGEVISCDSRQVYRNLDIGTAKVTDTEMDGVPHHLLDVADVTETYTANDFKQAAEQTIADIINRGKLPIVAGGTFFYLDQLRGKNLGPAVAINKRLRQELETLSTTELYQQVVLLDPQRATSIDKHNRRRLIRTLEIINHLGKVPESPEPESPYQWLVVGIEIEKTALLKRLKQRAKDWLSSGIMAETKWLLAKVSPARFKEFGFEYTITKACIDGEITEAELEERFVEKNWQYAKRQLTWLKRDQDIVWFKPNQTAAVTQCVSDWLS